MSKRPESCTHRMSEPCRLHPVDCPNCVYGDRCQQRTFMQKYPEKIKSCRFFLQK